MRILTLTNLYPPHALGGYEWSCHDIMRRLRDRHHEITVLTTTTRFPSDGADEELMPDVRRELEWYWDDHRLLDPPIWARVGIERRNHRRLLRVLDAIRPDVVSAWNVGAMSLGMLRTIAERHIPIVYACCDAWPVYAPQMDAWRRIFGSRPRLATATEALLRVPTRSTDLGPTGAFCFVSEHTREACVRDSAFTFPRSTVVHSGIEPEDFPVVDLEPVSDWRGRLLYVGRLDVRKGVLTAVDALALLDASHTHDFIGRGDAEEQILRRAADRGVADRVRIQVLPRSELASRYRDADAFLFTSEWDEPFGLTPIEAMACATPVIGTGTGGSGEFLLDGRTCVRYPAGDAVALAEQIRRLAADPRLRSKIVAGGRAVARELTTDRLAEIFEQWHVAAAAGYPDGSPSDRPLLEHLP